MNWVLLPVALILWLSAFASVSLGYHAWQRYRYSSLARGYALTALGIGIWSFCYALEIVNTSTAIKLFWSNLQYVGVGLLGPGFTILALSYTNRTHWLSRRLVIGLSIEPLLTLVLLFTDPWHNLVRVDPRLDTAGSFLTLNFSRGPWYWINNIYLLALILFGSILILENLTRSPKLYRNQSAFMLLGILLPWIANLLDILNLNPFTPLDITVFAFLLTSLSFAWAIFRYRMFDLIPYARDMLVENMGVGMLVIDQNSQILDINPAACEIFNLPGESLIGKPAIDFLPRDLIAQITTTEPEKPTQRFEYNYHTRDDLRTYSLRAAALTNFQTGSFVWLVTFSDISLLKKSQEYLKQTQANFKLLADNVREIFWLTSPDSKEVYFVNQAYETLTGFTVESLYGASLSWLDVLHPDDYQRMKDAIAAGLYDNHAGIREYEFRYHRADGTTGWILFRSQPVEDADGAVIARTGTAMDITDRKIAEQRIRSLLQAERVQRQYAEALQGINTALSGTLELDALLDLMLEQIDRVVPYDSGNIMLIRGEEVHVARSRGYEKFGPQTDQTVNHLKFNLKKVPNLLQMAHSRQPTFISDVRSNPNWLVWELAEHIRSWVGAPVIARDQLIGFISLDKADVDFYTPQHALRLSAFAAQAALAIQNATLYAETQQRLVEQAIVTEIGQAVASSLELDELLTRIYQQVGRIIDTTNFFIALYHPELKEFTVPFEIEGQRLRTNERYSIHQGLTGYMIRTRTPLLLIDWEAMRDFEIGHDIKVLDELAACWMGTPLIAQNEVIGVMAVQSYTQPYLFNEHDLEIFQVIGSQVAVALLNSRLYATLQRQLGEAESLRQIGATVASTLNQKKAIDFILEQLRNLVPYDSVSVHLHSEGMLEVVGGRGFADPERIIGVRYEMTDETPNMAVYQTRQPLILYDVQEQYADFRNPPNNHIHGWMGVPLLIQDRMIGMLAIDSRQPGRFTPEHARLVGAVADQYRDCTRECPSLCRSPALSNY